MFLHKKSANLGNRKLRKLRAEVKPKPVVKVEKPAKAAPKKTEKKSSKKQVEKPVVEEPSVVENNAE